MRIGIDARFLTHPQMGGFKTYTENLVKALSLIDSSNSYVLYLDRPPTATTLPQKSNFSHRVVKGSFPLFGMPIREQIGLARCITRDRIDVMHFPCLTATLASRRPFVLTLHDTIWLHTPLGSLRSPQGRSPKRWAMWFYNRWVPQWAARRAGRIITVSHAAKADIVKQLKISPNKISVVHNVVKDVYQPREDGNLVDMMRRRYDLDKKFILGIGSADPRKNIAGLINAYAQLPREQRSTYQLAIVWTHSFLHQQMSNLINDRGVSEQVTFLRDISDEALALLYNAATLFAFPSHYEGFGLPPLEAMACGTPVVAANNSSIPEIVGDAGLLVESSDSAALAQAMQRVLDDADLRAKLVQKGLERAKNFSWERFGKETLEILKNPK